MIIDNLLSAIEEYLELKRSAQNGTYDDEDGSSYGKELTEIRKRFGLSLNELIDFRMDGVLELRKKRASSTTRNVTIPDPDMEWADIIAVVDALNCAPNPPKGDLKEMFESGKLQQWLECYERWFKDKRYSAIQSPKSDSGRYYKYGDDIEDKK